MSRNLKTRVVTLVVVLLVAYVSVKLRTPERQSLPDSPPVVTDPQPESPIAEEVATQAAPATKEPPSKTKNNSADSPSSAGKTIVRTVTIRGRDGNQVFTGDVDLTATLQRIDAGRKLSFPNDGSVFQNRERRLPNKSSGHYREWVHPTPSLDGPGPQRVVTGQTGEAYYTPDHYRTFKKIR